MKAMLAAALGLTASMLMVAQAAAAGPIRQPAPIPPLPPFTGICTFDVGVQFPVNDEVATIFTDSNANITHVITTGHLVATFTNLTTLKSLTENLSGPSFTTYNADGSVTIVTTGVQGGPEPTFFGFGAGRIVIQIGPAPAFTITSSVVGNFQLLCSLLG